MLRKLGAQVDVIDFPTQSNTDDLNAAIKAAKIKVTTQQQDDQIRVSGPKKDDLQAVIQLVRGQDFGIDMQFINMR